MAVSIVGLTIFGIAGFGVAFWMARRVGRVLNFRSLLVANYVLVSLVSGIVHLLRLEPGSRGFFDVLTGDQAVLQASVMAAVLGLVPLTVGCLIGLKNMPAASIPAMTGRDRIAVSLTTVVIAPLALLGLARMQQSAAASDSVRVLTVDQGEARYVFMSHWAVWLVTFIVVLLLSMRAFKGPFASLTVTFVGLALITLALAWTGGRSIIVVMCLPLLLICAPRFRRVFWVAGPAMVVAAVVYIVSLTAERTAGARTSSSLATWLDWEWGRFSMVGFAQMFVSQNGFLGGETFMAAISNVVLGMSRLAGIFVPNPDFRAMPQITGEYILGTGDSYVVAGLSSELYVNFGLAGVVVGLFLLGWAAALVDARFASSGSLVGMIFWAYLGSLIVFRTLAADANAIGSFFFYSGAPILLLCGLSWVLGRRTSRGQVGLRRHPSEAAGERRPPASATIPADA